MEITKQALLNVSGVLGEMVKTRMRPQLAYIVAKNHVKINEQVELIRTSYVPIDGWQEVLKARQEALSTHQATQHPNGGYQVPPDQQKGLEDTMKAIDAAHKDIIEAQAKYDEEFNADLQTMVEVDLEKIKSEDLSEDVEPMKLVSLMQAGLM
ncbi:MAG: hypothetical protein HKO79_12490 [Desulfobacterales bacterium]|nr:hypothetical protein [Desulfobacterales bacterium]